MFVCILIIVRHIPTPKRKPQTRPPSFFSIGDLEFCVVKHNNVLQSLAVPPQSCEKFEACPLVVTSVTLRKLKCSCKSSFCTKLGHNLNYIVGFHLEKWSLQYTCLEIVVARLKYSSPMQNGCQKSSRMIRMFTCSWRMWQHIGYVFGYWYLYGNTHVCFSTSGCLLFSSTVFIHNIMFVLQFFLCI